MYRIYTHIYVCMRSRFSAELGNKHTPLFLANPPRDQLAYQKAERTQRRRRPACSDIVCIISSKSYYARTALYGKCPKAQSPIGIRIYVDVLHLKFGSIRFNHNSIINHISFLSFAFLYILVFPAEP